MALKQTHIEYLNWLFNQPTFKMYYKNGKLNTFCKGECTACDYSINSAHDLKSGICQEVTDDIVEEFIVIRHPELLL